MKFVKLLFLLFYSVIVYAQNVEIKGHVSFPLKDDFVGYNLILLNKNDSSFYKGDFSSTPSFILNVEKAKLPLLLKISSLGYEEKIVEVTGSTNHISVILSPDSSTFLSDVVIEANQPLYTVNHDRISMKIENTILSQSGSMIDVLQKMARIKIDNNGVSVLGVGAATIYIDGRKVSSSQILESMSSTEIEKIDIITQPSAKYDADGKAIIEIKTKRRNNLGWGGSLYTRIGKSSSWNESIGGDISAKFNNLFLYTSYSYIPLKYYYNESYQYDNLLRKYSIMTDRDTRANSKNKHSLRFVMDYNFNLNHTIGVQFDFQFQNRLSNIFNNSQIFQCDQNEVSASEQNSLLNKRYGTGSAYYSYLSKNKKSSLIIFYDRVFYKNSDNAEIQENYTLKNNNMSVDIKINTLKADWDFSISNVGKLNIGGKYSHAKNSSFTFFKSYDINREISYDYKENISAMYMMFEGSFKRISYEIGLRSEYSTCKAYNNGKIIYNINNSNFDFFPDVSLSYNLLKDLDLKTSYSKKISRPTFEDLNPSIDYIDSLTYFQGNPNLTAEIQHSFGVNLIYKKYASLGMTYVRRNNLLSWNAMQDDTNPVVTKATQVNIDHSDSYSVDLVLPYQNNLLTTSLATGAIFTKTKDESIKNLSKLMWYLYINMNINLCRDFSFATNIRYFTKGVENVFYFDPVFRMDISVQRSFLDKKLLLTLSWDDVFKSDKMKTYTTIGDRNIIYKYYFDKSVIRFSVSYKFNLSKGKYKRHVDPEKYRIKGL